MFDHYKTNFLSRYLNVARVASFKAAKKSLARTHGIESPNTFQTFAHGFNSNSH